MRYLKKSGWSAIKKLAEQPLKWFHLWREDKIAIPHINSPISSSNAIDRSI